MTAESLRFFDIDNLGMNDNSLTRVYLESLSSDELLRLADSFGIDIPLGLERVFIIEELLETYSDFDDEDVEFSEDINPDFTEAALPKHYNISFIEVIIRDPLWAFVLWEIKSHDREILEKAPDFEGYCLRVIPIASSVDTKAQADGRDTFTVPVGVNDTGWYLGFPPDEGWYKVELCARRGTDILPLIVSRPFRLPKLPEQSNHNVSKSFQEIYDNPLIGLSGVHEFPVIRFSDRDQRARDGLSPV
jgi:hypothetical protein